MPDKLHTKQICRRIAIPLLVIVAFLAARGSAEEPAEPVKAVDNTLVSGSRARHVHWIHLYDAGGKQIDPADESAPPYSPAATCGKCHSVNDINHGWHTNEFDEPSASNPPGRRGEPWILSDGATGTQIPISNRGWAGTFKPEQVGLSQWSFTKMFGPHTAGNLGPTDLSAKDADPKARWKISGRLENDCMICHSNDNRHDQEEWGRQIEQENFKWAPTVAMGLGVVKGSAKALPATAAPPPKPAENADGSTEPAPEEVKPKTLPLKYDKGRFDADKRVFFDVAGHVSADRCYYCHTTREVGPKVAPRFEHDGDIHLRAGMKCTDCHRNGIDHSISRGDEPTTPSAANVISCRGCHLGNPESTAPVAMGGRLGAPHPAHKGLPPLHLEKLTCTACHSGPWPEQQTQAVQTSMAHNLGKAMRGRRDDVLPKIVEPVFARDDNDHRVGPYRLLWPAYWGYLKDGAVTPVTPVAVKKAMRAAEVTLPRDANQEQQIIRQFADEDVAKTLAALAEVDGATGTAVYLHDGKVYQLDGKPEDHKIKSDVHAAANPYMWALGHDVRPRSQSLGVRGCTDCHSTNSAFEFGKLTSNLDEELAGRPDAKAVALPIENMLDLRRDEAGLAKAWAFSFGWRSVFKVFAFATAGLFGLLLFVHGVRGLVGILRWLQA